MFRYGSKSVAVYRRVFRRASLLLVPSEYARRRLADLDAPGEKTHVVPISVDNEFFTFAPRGLEAPPIHLLSVGRLAHGKGLEYAVQAVSLLRAKFRTTYTIAGPSSTANASIRATISRLGLEDTVHLAGAVDRSQVRALMRKAHVLLLPSITDKNGAQESAGAVAREAAATGLPIVATRTGGIAEFVEHGHIGFLVPERDASAIADAVTRFIDEPALIGELGQNGRDRVSEGFTLSERIQSLDKLFRALPHVS